MFVFLCRLIYDGFNALKYIKMYKIHFVFKSFLPVLREPAMIFFVFSRNVMLENVVKTLFRRNYIMENFFNILISVKKSAKLLFVQVDHG